MSQQDREKWDKKYQQKPKLLEFRQPSRHLAALLEKIKARGDALDLASGNGRHSLYLAKQGFHVDALDIAAAALESLEDLALKQNVSQKIHTRLIDLDDIVFELGSYDLIVMSNYLDRDLIEQAKLSLKSGGIFFVETYMDDPINEKENSNPEFLLQKEELKKIFDTGFETLVYDEFENEPHELWRMKKQVIAAKKL